MHPIQHYRSRNKLQPVQPEMLANRNAFLPVKREKGGAGRKNNNHDHKLPHDASSRKKEWEFVGNSRDLVPNLFINIIVCCLSVYCTTGFYSACYISN